MHLEDEVGVVRGAELLVRDAAVGADERVPQKVALQLPRLDEEAELQRTIEVRDASIGLAGALVIDNVALGPAIGGISAAHFGYRATFAISAAMAFACGFSL